MKAAILEQINSPLTVADVGLTDLSCGQVLVKVLVSGLCGSQLQEIAGNKGNAKFIPHLLGHEGCGIVQDIGVGVTRVKKGDKVVMHWRKGEGIESDFPSYIYKGKTMRSGKITTLSEYSIVSENRITPVPADTPNELCALLGCGLSTALGLIDNETNLKLGESFMTVGAGGLGANLILAAKLAGAYPIIAVDVHEGKREMAEALGAHLYINSQSHDIRDEISKTFGIKSVDVVVDTSGSKAALEATIPLLSGTGRYIMLGHPKPDEAVELRNANHFFEGDGKHMNATQGGQFSPSKDIPRYIRLFTSGVAHIDHIISHRMNLDGINDAVELVRQGQAGRIMITL